MKIVLTYTELRALLAPVIPHAGSDDMLPVLTTIPVAASGDYLVAQATDRFTAGFKRIKPAEGVPAGFAMTLGASDAKRMINLFRPARGSDPAITIELDDAGRINASADDSGLALGFVGLNVSFLTLPDTASGFPDLASLVPANFDDAASTAAFNIAFLARFRAAMEHSGLDRNEQALRIQMGAGERKPLFVAAGDDFIGLIMPRLPRTNTVADVAATWRGNIPRNGTKPPKSKPTKVKGPVVGGAERPSTAAVGAGA